MQDIESEGNKVTSQRDPPGQRSVYVAPGRKLYLILLKRPSEKRACLSGMKDEDQFHDKVPLISRFICNVKPS